LIGETTWRSLAVLVCLTLGLAGGGCRGRLPEAFVLQDSVKKGDLRVGESVSDAPGLTFPRAPEIRDLEIDHERRSVVLTSTDWQWRGRVPAGGRLNAGVQLLPGAWKVIRGLRVTIALRDGDTREIVEVASTTEREELRWLDFEADLSRFAGREITLEVSATLDGLPPRHRDSNLVAWGPVHLSGAAERAEKSPPNVLFILVDTLRHDRLAAYGYERHQTSPEIQRWLAEPGAVVEEAYSQAPWTLPSVISFMTGISPGEMLGTDMTSFGIPAGVKPLAERMAELGYRTGGFVGNPVLHAGAGFGRGFGTYYAPPADVQWLRRHADDINRHAVPWLRSFQREPFFLYVHYIDPHDPYENPEMINGRAFFMPDYTGAVAGDWIHGIYNGRLQMPDPERDIPYIQALYDGEVRYVDRHIGALLAALDPEILENTLIVLTADHGEELGDHGGWKHGQTLYEEQIHVPLIVRWDGHVKPGTRLSGTVRLLDLVPTLLAATGGKAEEAFDGVDLLPALTGQGELPRRPAFAEGLSGGPLRAAAVLDRQKLILFNREEPFRPADALQEHLWKVDLERMRRAELYDLSKDPGERADLAQARPREVQALEPIIHDQLARELPGLWLLPEGLPAGARLSGSIAFEQPPRGWTPYFLGPEDRVELSGGTLRFALTGERGGRRGKGLRIEGPSRITAVAASLEGRPLPPGAVRLGADSSYGGGAVSLAALRSPRWPLAGQASSGVRLRLWMHDGSGAVERRTSADPKTEETLRSLGYIQ
jgi:arylsulfatase A-like enzyme